MIITWVTRAFSNYRIPLFKALDDISGGNFHLIFSGTVNSPHLIDKVQEILGDHAIPLAGEITIGGVKSDNAAMANSFVRIPFQPGLLRTILRTRPDVLLSDGFFQWTYGPLWLRAKYGIPHIMCYERTAYTERNAQWYRTLYRKVVLRWIDRIICSGTLCGQYIESLGYQRSKILYGHMVADVGGLRESISKMSQTERTRVREQFRTRYIMLYTGQIIPRKGIRELLNAWRSSLLCNNPDITLLLIGDGGQLSDMINLCSGIGINNVNFLGRIPYDDVGSFYAISDAFIIPTLEDNWSLVVPEAMACELPILSSQYNGCWPELVTKANGWVFDSRDRTAFAECLNAAWCKREIWKSMGKMSSNILSEHTPQRAAVTLFSACQTVTHAITQQKAR